MNNKQNLHIHTTYADGKDTPEQMVLTAMERGFDSIGFSEHCFNPYSKSNSQMLPHTEPDYKAEVRALKEKYKGKLDVFCGIELEFFCDVDTDDYDYVIGSVHYLNFDGNIQGFDGDLQRVRTYLQEFCGNDPMVFARKYYETVARLPEKGRIDILGHFDLLTKNNEQGCFLDTSAKAYLDFGFETIGALKGKIPFFEVNTGAISRGYRTAPYPQTDFLRQFYACGFGAMITSDCHDRNYIDCYFEEARLLLAQAGFTTRWILTDDGFKEVKL